MRKERIKQLARGYRSARPFYVWNIGSAGVWDAGRKPPIAFRPEPDFSLQEAIEILRANPDAEIHGLDDTAREEDSIMMFESAGEVIARLEGA